MKHWLNKKWETFEKRVRLFNSIPFVDFVLGSGSMATGTAREDSDLDVIVGAKYGRIFTARFFSVLFFGLRDWRVKKHEDKVSVQDKICLNHFVTPISYKLSPPYNDYWANLYRSLVPMMGSERQIKDFFRSNAWAGEATVDMSHWGEFRPSFLRRELEAVLAGRFGDMIERLLKSVQIRKIKSGVNDEFNYKPRLVYTDYELELHPHTYRIEEFCKNPKDNLYIKESI